MKKITGVVLLPLTLAITGCAANNKVAQTSGKQEDAVSTERPPGLEYLVAGNRYMAMENYKKAESAFRKGLAEHPGNEMFRCQIALSLIEQGRVDEAENELRKILAGNPANFAARWYLGAAYYKSEKYRKAMAIFRTAKAHIGKDSPQYLALNWYIGQSLALLLSREGLSYDEVDEMLASYSVYLALDPSAPDYTRIQAFVERVAKIRPSKKVVKWRHTSSAAQAKDAIKDAIRAIEEKKN